MRFVSVGECLIEMTEGDDGRYDLCYTGDGLVAARYVRRALPDAWTVDLATAVGDDAASRRLVRYLASEGIGVGAVQVFDDLHPGLALIDKPGNAANTTQWRERSAARAMTEDRKALADGFANADCILFSGPGLAILGPRARGRLMKALHTARSVGARIAFAPNEQPELWTSARVMGSCITAAAILADVVIANYPDGHAQFGDASPAATAHRYIEIGADEVAVRDGDTLHSFTRDGASASATATGLLKANRITGAYLAARLMGASTQDAVKAAI
jgi:2-dehydro-3-deoxygluconokinase